VHPNYECALITMTEMADRLEREYPSRHKASEDTLFDNYNGTLSSFESAEVCSHMRARVCDIVRDLDKRRRAATLQFLRDSPV